MAAQLQRVAVEVVVPWAPEGGAVPDRAAIVETLGRLWIVEEVRLRRIGVAKGAELLHMPRAAFMTLLGEHGVPVIDYRAEELDAEVSGSTAP